MQGKTEEIWRRDERTRGREDDWDDEKMRPGDGKTEMTE